MFNINFNSNDQSKLKSDNSEFNKNYVNSTNKIYSNQLLKKDILPVKN